MKWVRISALTNGIKTRATILGDKVPVLGGPHSTVDSILASHPAAPGSILGVPKIFSEIISLGKILDVVEIYRQRTA